jgi:hypothetical protein
MKPMSLSLCLITSIFLVVNTASAGLPKPATEYCKDVGNEASTINVTEFEGLEDQAAMEVLAPILLKDSFYNSFILFSSPSVGLAEKVSRWNLINLMKSICKKTPLQNSLVNLLEESRTCLSEVFTQTSVKHTLYGDHVSHLSPYKENLESAQTVMQGLCERVKIPAESCGKNILGYLSLIAPGGKGPMTTLAHEVVRISVDPRLVKISEGLSLYLLALMEDAAKTGNVKGKDIYSDLVAYFQGQKFSPEQSRDLTFYFLGVYATRGASFFAGFDDIHPSSLSALVTLSLAISYLDKLALRSGRSYAIPAQYQTTCSIGKPYHFWLAAFLGVYTHRQGFSKVTGYFGPVMSGIAYDITMDANDRNIMRLFSIKTPFDFYANMTRIDNFSRTLGAHFGMHEGNPPKVNGDALLTEFFEKAKMPRKTVPVDGEIFREYFYMIQPETLFLKLAL